MDKFKRELIFVGATATAFGVMWAIGAVGMFRLPDLASGGICTLAAIAFLWVGAKLLLASRHF